MIYRRTGHTTIEVVGREISDIPEYLGPVLEYWQNLRGDRLAPAWREFNLLALPSKALPMTQVLDWLPEQEEFRFRFCGTAYAVIHGVELTGKSPKDIPFRELGDFIHGEYLAVIRSGEANLISYGYREGKDFIEIETCLRLPLSNDGKTITGIVTVDVVTESISEARDIVEDLVNRKANFRNFRFPGKS